MTEIVAHYEILEKLGEGGMGVVYRARDTKLGRETALKLLPEDLASNPAYLQRFQREARAASALNHPNICTIFEIGEHQGRHYIAMEMLKGQILRGFMQGRPMPVDQIIRIALQTADALQAAHDKGIIHRDIKPANIFVTQRGHVKILDFGLAKLASAKRAESRGDAGSDVSQPRNISFEYISSPSITIGTLPYMSPEQALGEELDVRTDLFSLGSVLYELSTGFPAFKGNTQPVLFQEILTKSPASPARLNPEIPQKLDDLICRLLEKDRELRWQTAADLCADLKRIKRDLDLQQGVAANAMSSTTALPGEHEMEGESPPVSYTKALKRNLAFFSFFRVFRKPIIALPSIGTALLLLMLGIFLSVRASMYFPCIEIGDFTGGSATVDAQTVGFALKRTLSQFPEVTVVNRQEFNHLLTIEKARKEITRSEEEKPSLLARLIPWQWEIREPAVLVSGHVSDSLGALEISLDCVVRGRKDTLVIPFRGVADLLNNGIDSLAQYALNHYDPSIAARHFAGRRSDYRTAVQLLSSRWDALLHYYCGARAWDRLEMNSAERELSSALEIDPNLALARLKLGEVLVFQNQWDAAQTQILAARSQASALTEADQLRVEAFYARVFGEPFQERVYLQKLIGLQPYKREYLYELAESYFHTADVDSAINRYMDALSLDSSYALAYNHLAYCYSWKGDHAQALETCSQYLDLDGSANAYDSLGDAYMHAGDYTKAEEMKNKAIEMDPQIYYASRNLAFIEMLRGRYLAAAERLNSLFGDTDDKAQKAQYASALAFLHYRKGNLNLALKMCNQGLDLLGSVQYDAPHDELIWMKGMIELKRDNLSAARRALGQLGSIIDSNQIAAENYKPAYKYWLHLFAWISAEEGNIQEAADAINDLKYIKTKLGYWSTPFDLAFFFDAIGQIYEKMKQPSDAEQAYNESLAYNPHFAPSRLHLARLLESKAHPDDARREMEAFWAEWQGADSDAAETIEARKISARLDMEN